MYIKDFQFEKRDEKLNIYQWNDENDIENVYNIQFGKFLKRDDDDVQNNFDDDMDDLLHALKISGTKAPDDDANEQESKPSTKPEVTNVNHNSSSSNKPSGSTNTSNNNSNNRPSNVSNRPSNANTKPNNVSNNSSSSNNKPSSGNSNVSTSASNNSSSSNSNSNSSVVPNQANDSTENNTNDDNPSINTENDNGDINMNDPNNSQADPISLPNANNNNNGIATNKSLEAGKDTNDNVSYLLIISIVAAVFLLSAFGIIMIIRRKNNKNKENSELNYNNEFYFGNNMAVEQNNVSYTQSLMRDKKHRTIDNYQNFGVY